VKEAIGYYVVRALTGLFGLLPEPAMRFIGRSIGTIGALVARRRFRTTMATQRRVLGPEADLRRAARRVFASYGRYWAEAFWVRPRRRDEVLRRSHVEGLEHLHAAVASDRGLVLALPHVGNWEAAGLRAAAEGARVLAVAEDLGNRRITDWFTGMRAMMDIDIVIARKGGRVTPALIERLRGGGTVALLADRDLKGNGVPVVLFGEETTMPAGPIALADRTGATVLPVGTYFKPGGGHRFHVHPPLEIPDAATTEERVRLGTVRLAAVIEDIVRQAPDQWHVVVPVWPADREEPA
jgi:KDO2-lipid IV(A) lauroyltransferase